MVLMRKTGHLGKTTSGTIHLAKCNPSCPCYDEDDSTVKTLPYSTITCELLYGAVWTPTGFTSQACSSSTYLGPPCVTGSGIETAFLTATTTRCTTLNVSVNCYFLGVTYGGFSINLSYYPNQIFAKWESYALDTFGITYYRSSITKVWTPRTASGYNVCVFDQSPVTTVWCRTHPSSDINDTTTIDCAADVDPDDLTVPLCDYSASDIDLAFS